jgi:GT2 family glycosyltransferase
MNEVTVVFTSCGRFNLLKQTVNSFVFHNTYPIKEYIVIENSENPQSLMELTSIFKDIENVKIIINEKNIGQVSSIDKAYEFVTTDYIFHCEDDWDFIKFGFIEKSMDILDEITYISNVNIRRRNDNSKGSFHPIVGPFRLKNQSKYYIYLQNYLGEWHGFSWNPGLRRNKDYQLIKPYKKYINEQGVNQKMKELGFFSACLEDYYCVHSGENSQTFKSNM